MKTELTNTVLKVNGILRRTQLYSTILGKRYRNTLAHGRIAVKPTRQILARGEPDGPRKTPKTGHATGSITAAINTTWQALTPAEKTTWTSARKRKNLPAYQTFLSSNLKATIAGRPITRTGPQ